MRALRVIAEVMLLTTLAGTIVLLGAVCPILLVVALHFSRDGCYLESAFVPAVPPSSTRIVAFWQCGALMCWSRSLQLQDGREVGVSVACESSQGDKLQGPTSAPVVPPS